MPSISQLVDTLDAIARWLGMGLEIAFVDV